MHELGLTRRVVSVVHEAAAAHGAARVTDVRLTVGENTCVLPESIRMYYDAAARGTLAEGARLHVTTVKCLMLCKACGKHFERPRFSFACPDCGALGAPTDIGNEFFVESITVDDGAPERDETTEEQK